MGDHLRGRSQGASATKGDSLRRVDTSLERLGESLRHSRCGVQSSSVKQSRSLVHAARPRSARTLGHLRAAESIVQDDEAPRRRLLPPLRPSRHRPRRLPAGRRPSKPTVLGGSEQVRRATLRRHHRGDQRLLASTRASIARSLGRVSQPARRARQRWRSDPALPPRFRPLRDTHLRC
jgi:hypothetical protein